MMNSAKKRQFIKYFHKRLESLNYCNATFENAIQDEQQDIMNMVNDGRIQSDAPEFSDAFFKLNYLILPTFRNCMLVAACTLIEDLLLQIGTDIIPSFESHVDRQKYLSTIRKYLKVLQDNLPIDFTPIEKNLSLIDDIAKVRNAIVHAWGRIDNCTNPTTLRKIISRRKWLQETGDGYILVGEETYAEAIEPTLTLFDHILNSIPVSDD